MVTASGSPSLTSTPFHVPASAFGSSAAAVRAHRSSTKSAIRSADVGTARTPRRMTPALGGRFARPLVCALEGQDRSKRAGVAFRERPRMVTALAFIAYYV